MCRRIALEAGLIILFSILSLGLRHELLAVSDIPKDNILAIEGLIVDIKPIPHEEETSPKFPLVIIVKAISLIDKEGQQEAKNDLWVFKIPEEEREAFQRCKKGDRIVAYGYREGDARILRVLGKDLGPFAPQEP